MEETFNIEEIKRALTELEPEIEVNPEIEEIKKRLGEIPSQVYYLSQRGLEVEKKISDLKHTIKRKKIERETAMSNTRMELLKKYNQKNKLYLEQLEELKGELSSGKKKLSQPFINDFIKANRPEKPTQSVLDDFAFVRTQSKATEILDLEKQISNYEHLLSSLRILTEKYETTKYAVNKHADLYIAEHRNGMKGQSM
ncbi:hypothetical protein IMZ31_21155 (plasmid) [Pontibacillus sp. ALD_SL1]|uniref:hypothetical protein n=1 Tax=Pontibacillus sp. ALD_SL1 TaxID=2777185 RepID=UPI001A9699DD|nr:hypothetical protein [Pontibacillus sp. ALD_SL1]QST03059.1 hypothetical protein IMZ31_21155 [Pontibacillus sp. ALD_SL1]